MRFVFKSVACTAIVSVLVIGAILVDRYRGTTVVGQPSLPGTTASPVVHAALWSVVRAHAGESSERFIPRSLGDLASVADTVVIGTVVANHGVMAITAPDGTPGDPRGASMLFLDMAVTRVVTGTVDTSHPIPIAVLVFPGPRSSPDGSDAAAFTSATLPSGQTLFSLIRNTDPSTKIAGFYNTYSPSSHRGIIEAGGAGPVLALGDSTSDDTTWTAQTLANAGSLDSLGNAIATAAAACTVNTCLTRAGVG